MLWHIKNWPQFVNSEKSRFKIPSKPELLKLFFRNSVVRNSHDCNDDVNFVCLTWFWSFPSGRCGQRTWKGNCCVFPFVYRGRRYNSCTRRGSKRFWCPIVPGYKLGQAWGYCRGKQGEIIFVIRFSSNKMASPSSNILILVHRGSISSKISSEIIGEFKKLRRQLQRKRHIKIELCVKLSLLRLFHVNQFVQNKRTALSLAWYEWFSCKGKEWKMYCCKLALSSEPQIKFENFTSSFSRLRQNIAPKSVPHVQHDCFSLFNQSNHWFVALSLTLPSSNLKLVTS